MLRLQRLWAYMMVFVLTAGPMVGDPAQLVSGRVAGLRTARPAPGIGGAAVTLEKAGATRFWSGIRRAGATRALTGGITRIWLDGKVSARLDRTMAQIGAPAVWQAGYNGAGVTVAAA